MFKHVVSCSLFLFFISDAIAASLESFPPTLQKTIFFEQKLIGTRNIEKDTLDPLYQPEQGKIFHVENYWVDQNKFEIRIDEKQFPPALKKIYFRTKNGRRQILISVHPDEKEYFKKIIEGAEEGPRFLSTASASPRSLITVATGTGKPIAFYNKLSVNKVLGGNVRLISKVELARSFFVTELLRQSKDILPRSFDYYPEAMVLIPKGWDKGGTIIRILPPQVQSGEVTHIPFFALYAAQPDGSKPLILRMAEKAKMPVLQFYETQILKPFLKHWMELALDHGITTEPHGQNLLLEVGRNGLPTGRFIHRDFGGFTIDIEHRKKRGLPVPVATEINSYRSTYNEADVGYGLKSSLDLYFGNIVLNLGVQYRQWADKGWVPTPLDETHFHAQLVKAVESAYLEKVGRPVHLEGRLPLLLEPMLKAKKLGFRLSCEKIYTIQK